MSGAAPRVGFRIYLISDGGEGEVARIEAALAALPPGSAALQLRAPGQTGRALFERAGALRVLTRRYGAAFLVGDRVDVALAVGADGAHLPARGLPAGVARRVAGALLLGASTHTLSEARMAAAGGADFVTFGPVWPTATHPAVTPVGIERLAEVAASLSVPVFALGGVDPSRGAAIVHAGARAACLRGVLGASDPAVAAAALLSSLGS